MDEKKRGKLPSMLKIYLILTCAITVCVALFAILYDGGGAAVLRDSGEEFEAALSKAEALDITPTPTPSAAPAEVSTSGRIIPYKSEGLWGYKNTGGQIVIAPVSTRHMNFQTGWPSLRKTGCTACIP